MWLYDNLNVLVYDAYVLKMDEDQWRYDFAMSQEVHMDYDYDNQEECGVNEPHVDCSNAFNMSQVIIDNLSHLVELMVCMKINMLGLRCRYSLLERMFCNGLEQLSMKMDLLQ